MAPVAHSFKDRYTYADYKTWPDDERWELIEGVAYNMSPAPTRKHQRLVGELYRRIGNYLDGKSCEVNPAPFDVRLPEVGQDTDDTYTVVQPDVSVFCDRTKLDDAGAKGAPDWVIEVLSPSTEKKDLSVKLPLYQTHGVREYWVVDPELEQVKVYQLNAQGYYTVPKEFPRTETVASVIFPELTIDLASVFAAAE